MPDDTLGHPQPSGYFFQPELLRHWQAILDEQDRMFLLQSLCFFKGYSCSAIFRD